jgi:hypothetical protein
MIHVSLMTKGLAASSVGAGVCCAGRAAQARRVRASRVFIVNGSSVVDAVAGGWDWQVSELASQQVSVPVAYGY